MTSSEHKSVLRSAVLRRRAALSAAEHEAASAAVLAAVSALRAGWRGPVAAYVSVGTEPGTRALLDALADVLLPVLLPDGDLDWAPYDGALAPGRFGLLEPPGQRLGRDAVAGCPVVLVPALSVDRRGTRLGRGGGSYDRALARTKGRVLAALHAGELVARLPAQPHDRPVHAVVLPDRGLVRLRRHPDDGPPGAAATITR